MQRDFTTIIEREGNGYVALCPELDIANQGETVNEARYNLQEALELFFETASEEEILERLHDEVYITKDCYLLFVNLDYRDPSLRHK